MLRAIKSPDKLEQLICILLHTSQIIENTLTPKLKKKDNTDVVQKRCFELLFSVLICYLFRAMQESCSLWKAVVHRLNAT